MRKQVLLEISTPKVGDRRRVKSFAWLPKIVSSRLAPESRWKWWVWLEVYWQWQTCQVHLRYSIDSSKVTYKWFDDDSITGRELYA